MSYVTGVVLCCSNVEDDDERQSFMMPVLEWLAHRGYGPLVMVGPNSHGGSKHPQMFVFTAGYNSFECDDFSTFIQSLPWQRPSQVVLVMTTEDNQSKVVQA